jgi:hypothetical protein
MAKKKKQPLQKQTLRLKDNHTWKAPKGYKIVVLDRGKVSFNVPEAWHLEQMEPHIELYDKAPPDDNSRLSVSTWQTPPGIDWSGLPLDDLLQKSTDGSELEILERGKITRSSRGDIELVWTEHRFFDKPEQREAFSRIAIARGFDVHALFTLDYWVDDSPQIRPIWNKIIQSIQLGRYIEDPTKGETLH